MKSTPAHATFPGQNGKIVFMSFDEVQADIYTMSPDGSHLRNLTNLTGLYLGETKVTGQGLIHLRRMTKLTLLILASTVDRSGCSGSSSPPALTSAKWPRTVIIPRCLAENST